MACAQLQIHLRGGLKTVHGTVFTCGIRLRLFLGTACSNPVVSLFLGNRVRGDIPSYLENSDLACYGVCGAINSSARRLKNSPQDCFYLRNSLALIPWHSLFKSCRLSILGNSVRGSIKDTPSNAMVEATGFEPAASASRTQRSTKLSHASIFISTQLL